MDDRRNDHQHKLTFNDEETVLQIQEDPYFQYILEGSPYPLPYKMQRQYWIIQHLYDQQDGMDRDRRSRCDNRIISISQPHVGRPIVRGKRVEMSSLVQRVEKLITRLGRILTRIPPPAPICAGVE